MPSRRLKFVTGFLVVGAAIAVLVAVSIQGNMAYYIEVSDYLSRDQASLQGNFRVRGNVIPGTIEKEPGKLGAIFDIGDEHDRLTIRYAKELPDTFVDHAEVVVEGEMTADGVFEAHTLLAKCPSKYEAQFKEAQQQPSS